MIHRVAATYARGDTAQKAIQDLEKAGIPREDIDVQVARTEDEVGAPIVNVTGAGRAALYWGLGGAVLGGVFAYLVATGRFAAPVFGFIGTQPLLGALKGLVVGGATATLFGFILGMGMWQEDGEPEDTAPTRGERIVTVRTTHKLETVKAVFRVTDGRNIRSDSDSDSA